MALGGSIVTWFDGRWQNGNVPILGSADHGTWQGTLVFDGARAFEGVMPDIDLHCARLLRSAAAMGLDATIEPQAVEALVRDGIRRLGTDRALYLRPMMWSREGSPAIIDALPGSTVLAICLEELPMREAAPFALTVSPFRRPSPDAALCEAKAACHYPNNARIAREARARGFHNVLSLDQQGNAFLVKDGVVMTPAANGTFLAGITRARVIALLRDDGVEVVETGLGVADFAAADEIFLTGNASKVVPVTRFEDRELGPSRVAARARALYWDFAHQGRRAA